MEIRVSDSGSTFAPLDILQAIYGHAKPESRIAFAHRTLDGAIKPLTNFPVADLRTMFPEVAKWQVEQTQYVGPNTYRPEIATRPFDGRPAYFRAGKEKLSELVTVWADLDVSHEEHPASMRYTPGQAVGGVLDLVLIDKLPMPSMVAFSGRGAYVLWILKSSSSDMAPPAATWDAIDFYQAIGRAIRNRLADFFADENATRPTQYLKRPGTIDMRTGKEVVFMPLVPTLSETKRYTLAELAAYLGVQVAPAPRTIEIAARPTAPAPLFLEEGAPARRDRRDRKPIRKVEVGKGAEPYHLRVREIERLNEYRRGTPDGKARRLTLFHYFAACRAWFRITNPDAPKGAAERYAAEQVRELNTTFRPPLPPGIVRDTMIQRSIGLKKSRTRNSVIARDLKVTPEEVAGAELRSIVPAAIAEDRKTRHAETKKKNADAKAAEQIAIDTAIMRGDSDAAISHTLGVDRQRVRYRRLRLQEIERSQTLPLPFPQDEQGEAEG